MKIPRRLITSSTIVIISAALIYAFRPRPIMVDMDEVKYQPMMVTIAEEGRTRVHDAYIVSTPVAGRLLRVNVEPGDPVIANESIIGSMRASHPTPLDIRDKPQAQANVSAAEAALLLADAEQERAVAEQALAETQLKRMQQLIETDSTSKSELDQSIRDARVTAAAVRTAEAASAVRKAELVGMRARLIDIETSSPEHAESMLEILIRAPASGRILRVIQESEVTLPAGTAIVEIGNIENDLEVLVELLSSDAVQIALGNRTIFTAWGGIEQLSGVVERIDPWGFTKVSALGVEEQRVNTLIRFTEPPEALKKLGHGFRVEAQIVIWEDKNAHVVPSSALFRENDAWAVFVVSDGLATLRRVSIGHNNGTEAQVTEGLELGDTVILYPSSALHSGSKVSQRSIP